MVIELEIEDPIISCPFGTYGGSLSTLIERTLTGSVRRFLGAEAVVCVIWPRESGTSVSGNSS
jgi:hypothetical protein